MKLASIAFDRSEFFNYRIDTHFRIECPDWLAVEETGIPVQNLCDFYYIDMDSPRLVINDLAISIAPYRLFNHVHLCRVLYDGVEIFEQNGCFVLQCGKLKHDPHEIRCIIDTAGENHLFDKKILDQYFDLFCISND